MLSTQSCLVSAILVVVCSTNLACGRWGFEESDAGSGSRDSGTGMDGGDTPDAIVPPADSASPTDSSSPTDAARNDSSAPTDSGSVPVDAAAVIGSLVVNEMAPQAGDFAELVNAGAGPLSLDGLILADLAGSGSPPADPTHRTPFPSGITLAPGEHFVISMNYGVDTALGLLTDSASCRGAPRCIQTSFGILAAGDTLAVLDGTGTILVSGVFPGRSTTGLSNPDSWCRIPDVTGGFALCAKTPGVSNTAR